jgi:glucose/arabinose dehydrogenase
MRTILTRRQLEISAAALLAAVAAIIGIAGRDEEKLGPRFLVLEKIGKFREPVQVVQPPRSELLFVLERAGRIRVVERGETVDESFLDLRDVVDDAGRGEDQGLVALAFPPDYQDSGRFYVSYTDRADELEVVEFRRDRGTELRARRSSARAVLTVPAPTPRNHAGMLAFGPDGLLYVGVGDGGSAAVAQNRSLLLGKLLRIDPRPPPDRRPVRPYRIPRDNPFVGTPGRDEIYAYGLQDPWRFSFDRATAALTIGDVGDETFEEIDYVIAGSGRGANFGWSDYEGREPFRGGIPRAETVLPVFVYERGPGCAAIGGYVVRDPRLEGVFGRELVGQYVFGDRCTGRLFAFRPHPDKAGKGRRLRFQIPELTSFGEDSAGRIYVLSGRGGIWRLSVRRKRR